jgi:hypothetical protein
MASSLVVTTDNTAGKTLNHPGKSFRRHHHPTGDRHPQTDVQPGHDR